MRSADMERDANDPVALEGYVVTPSLRDATTRILSGLSDQSSQRAFRVVGPYGSGKSAFGVYIAQLFSEQGIGGPGTGLMREILGDSVSVPAWHPIIINGRRASFARELLNVAVGVCADVPNRTGADIRRKAKALLDCSTSLDVQAVAALVSEAAGLLRRKTGAGLLLLVDEMGRFLEHAANRINDEDPSIFQIIAESACGGINKDFSVICFLHHRFVDYVSDQGGWIEAEWARSAERYEEIAFQGSTEQSLFMLSRALDPETPHPPAIRKKSQKLYQEAVKRNLFAVVPSDVADAADSLYPLHPAAVSTLCLAARRYGQNERSLFSFLQSLEPASFKQYIHANRYHASNWYRLPLVFDYLSATIPDNPGGVGSSRYTMALNALASTGNMPEDYRNVLKAIALIAVLEPVPGLRANARMIAWSLGIKAGRCQSILDDLTERNVIYLRPHRGDYGLWSSSSVDLPRWVDEARAQANLPRRIEDISHLLTSARPAVAHRHYHETGTLRTFDVVLWSADKILESNGDGDGLILIVPVHPDEEAGQILSSVHEDVFRDPLILICTRKVSDADLKWARELTLWTWIRDNCQELRLDDIARTEVDERIMSAEQAMTNVSALLSAASSIREEQWWIGGEPVSMPKGGLSTELSKVCDLVFNRSPILRNELINRSKLTTAIASARMRLLKKMLDNADQEELGMEGTPPERTIYLSLFRATGIHKVDSGGIARFAPPGSDDSCRWGPVWSRISELLEAGESLTFSVLLDNLAAVPYGLRTAPALLLAVAYILAYRDSIAIMERNTFQPDLTAAHFMRLAKNPRNFVLRALHTDERQSGLIGALACDLQVLGTCQSTIRGVADGLYSWYNSLAPYALKTKTVSAMAVAVREILGKAVEPVQLLSHDLPQACDSIACGKVDIGQFIQSLNTALLELDSAMPRLRSSAIEVATQAFGVPDLDALQCRIRQEYEPHRLRLADYRLLVFVDRAMNRDLSPEIWLDGVAGHLTGSRPGNWTDETLDRFEYEIRSIAGTLARWLVLFRTKQADDSGMRSIHVVSADGREDVVIVRGNQQNPALVSRLNAVRNALGTDPGALEILGQLLLECAEGQANQK